MYIWLGKHLWLLILTFLSKTTDFSRLPSVTYTVKVVVSRKWCKIHTFLLHTTTYFRKCHTAYRLVPFPMTLNWPWRWSLAAGLLNCNSTSICATFRTVSTDTARRAVPQRHLSFSSKHSLSDSVANLQWSHISISYMHTSLYAA